MMTTLLHNPDLIGSSSMSKVRVPIGRLILELPAGMLDDDKGDFVGTAAREVSLSLSLRINTLVYTSVCICIYLTTFSCAHNLLHQLSILSPLTFFICPIDLLVGFLCVYYSIF